MQNWLRIFRGETVSTPAEILAEIKNLESERDDFQAAFTKLQAKLESKRLEHLGGNSSAGDLKKLKNQVSDARENIKALDLAMDKMQALHKTALENEKDSAIADIDQALMDLEKDRKKMTASFLAASAKAAALSFLLRGGEVFQLSPKNTPLALTGVERQPYFDRFNEIVNSQTPLTAKRIDLIIQRSALQEQA
jgi:hypothetical protein